MFDSTKFCIGKTWTDTLVLIELETLEEFRISPFHLDLIGQRSLIIKDEIPEIKGIGIKDLEGV